MHSIPSLLRPANGPRKPERLVCMLCGGAVEWNDAYGPMLAGRMIFLFSASSMVKSPCWEGLVHDACFAKIKDNLSNLSRPEP